MKKLTMVTAGAIHIALGTEVAAQAVVLTFDDYTNDIASIPNGYGELDWSNFSYADSSSNPAYLGSGYVNGTVSGNYVAFNRYGDPATLESSSGFDFNSAYLSAAWNNGLSITVEGLSNGESLYSTTVVVDTTSSTLVDFNYQGIDELRFTSFGGVNAGFEDHRGREGAQFVLDNFTFNKSASVSSPVVLVPAPAPPAPDLALPIAIAPAPTTPEVLPVVSVPDISTPTPIPYEPSSGLGLLILGAIGAGAVLKRRLRV